MERWSIIVCDDGRGGMELYLHNRSRTPIRVGRGVRIDVPHFLSELRRVEFPLAFTEGIELIQFRKIKGCFGQYDDGVIDIGFKPRRKMKVILETFVHEVAHHLDFDREMGVSKALDGERRLRGRYLEHAEARRDTEEYFARGFEKFYSGDASLKRRLRERNPRLYRLISRLHRKYRRR